MPNGHDRNWIRFCGAVDGYRARYGKWPPRVAMEQVYCDDLRRMFAEAEFAAIEARIELRARDGAHMIAEDDAGNVYDYGREGFSDVEPDERARDWFGVEPINEDW